MVVSGSEFAPEESHTTRQLRINCASVLHVCACEHTHDQNESSQSTLEKSTGSGVGSRRGGVGSIEGSVGFNDTFTQTADVSSQHSN